MVKLLRGMVRAYRIIARRIRSQGISVTAQWAVAMAVSWITGAILLRFSRVTPNLYVGPQYGQAGKRALERNGVTAGVNLRAEFDDAAHGLALEQYCYLPVEDETAPTLDQMIEGVAFIQQRIDAGDKVYVHCGSGVGRSPMLAVAYFLAAGGLSLDEAIEHIRNTRPFISILPDQMARLRQYAAYLAGRQPQSLG